MLKLIINIISIISAICMFVTGYLYTCDNENGEDYETTFIISLLVAFIFSVANFLVDREE